MKKIIASISSVSISSLGLLLPLPIAQAAEFCEGGVCEAVFNKTEQVETWQVPEGIAELEFEVYGGQGGANGGRGGFVSGTLTNLPDQLIIIVGGQGARGSNLDGGYNGGGFSGGRDGNPGSGGGASDIRFGTELADRVVVAGGGGGFGGPVGGSGGAGGGESASDGSAGQGGAGAGGTQLSGGAGGRSNSGQTNGSSGRLGVGGEGGYTSSGYGGGGGGAGYFGGGGGGADTDTCCLDAGGGGGGSSYADATVTSGVTFQPGFQAGDGKIILRYSLPPTITEFSYQQTSPLAAEVTLNFDSAVTGVQVDDFVVTGCADKSLAGENASYTLSLDNCESLASVGITANSFGDNSNSPTSDQLLELELDQIAPTASFNYPQLINQNYFTVAVETDLSGIFDESAVSSIDCQLAIAVEENLATITATDCPEGEVGVVFETAFLVDSIGNRALTEQRTISVSIDTTSPVISVGENRIDELEIEGEKTIHTQTPVSFSDPGLSFEDFTFTGDDACLLSHELTEQSITLKTNGCPAGLISWALAADSLSDLAGNTAPAEELLIELQIPEIQAEPEPVEEAVQPPALPPAPGPVFIPAPEPQPAPIPESTPTPETSPEPEVEPEPEIETEPEPESEPEIEQPAAIQEETDSEPVTVTPEPIAQTQEPELETESTEETETGNQEVEMPLTEIEETQTADSDSEQALPIAQIQEKQDAMETPGASPWAIGFASFLVLGLLVGVVFLTKNNRARAIK